MAFNQTGLPGIVLKEQHKQESGRASMHHFTPTRRIRMRRVCSLHSCVFTERGQWKSMEGKRVAWSQGQNLAGIIMTSYCVLEYTNAFLLGRAN